VRPGFKTWAALTAKSKERREEMGCSGRAEKTAERRGMVETKATNRKNGDVDRRAD